MQDMKNGMHIFNWLLSLLFYQMNWDNLRFDPRVPFMKIDGSDENSIILRRPCVLAFLDVDLQLAVEEGALAQLDRLAAPLGLGGVRRGGGLPPEEPAAAQGRRHRHSAPSPGLPPPPESVDASQTQFEGH